MKNWLEGHLGSVTRLSGCGLLRATVAGWNPAPSGTQCRSLKTGGGARMINQALR